MFLCTYTPVSEASRVRKREKKVRKPFTLEQQIKKEREEKEKGTILKQINKIARDVRGL
jgi:hypothetical protein